MLSKIKDSFNVICHSPPRFYNILHFPSTDRCVLLKPRLFPQEIDLWERQLNEQILKTKRDSPVDNRPSIFSSSPVTCYPTPDVWHLRCDTWHTGGGQDCLKIAGPLPFYFLCEAVLKICAQRISKFLINESTNYKGFCGTVPGTLGLLKILFQKKTQCTVERYSLIKPKKYLLRKINFGWKPASAETAVFGLDQFYYLNRKARHLASKYFVQKFVVFLYCFIPGCPRMTPYAPKMASKLTSSYLSRCFHNFFLPSSGSFLKLLCSTLVYD